MMPKQGIHFGLACLLAVLALVPAGAVVDRSSGSPSVVPQDIRVTVDGDEIAFDQPPVMRGGRVLVPVRGVFEKFGAEVVYSPEKRMVVATKGEIQIEIWINQRDATIDGATKTLDQPAIVLGGRAMVPLRFLSEALGADVEWLESDMLVRITTK